MAILHLWWFVVYKNTSYLLEVRVYLCVMSLYVVADHIEDDTLCRVDVNLTMVERQIVRHVVDDLINNDDEKLFVQCGSNNDEEQ